MTDQRWLRFEFRKRSGTFGRPYIPLSSQHPFLVVACILTKKAGFLTLESTSHAAFPVCVYQWPYICMWLFHYSGGPVWDFHPIPFYPVQRQAPLWWTDRPIWFIPLYRVPLLLSIIQQGSRIFVLKIDKIVQKIAVRNRSISSDSKGAKYRCKGNLLFFLSVFYFRFNFILSTFCIIHILNCCFPHSMQFHISHYIII